MQILISGVNSVICNQSKPNTHRNCALQQRVVWIRYMCLQNYNFVMWNLEWDGFHNGIHIIICTLLLI